MKKILLYFLPLMCLTVFAQNTHTVNGGMSGGSYYFTPENLTIEQGDIVVWINDGGCHDVNGDINTITNVSFNNPETFDSPTTCDTGAEIFTYTFNVTGTYNYDCSVGSHAVNGMVGTVTVNAPVSNTVVDIIVNSDNHTTLETAVGAAGLVDALSADGPFTIFAPTDAAFAALPVGLLDDLLADPSGQLADVLTYHVASGYVLSTELSDGMMITTLNGEDITVNFTDDGVMINNAMVTTADILADNGVVHVINAVLVPEAETTTVVDIIVNSENHTTLETAVIAAGLVEDLSDLDENFTVFAPTDEAFLALPDGALDDLLADPTGLLSDILLHHVAFGSALSTDLTDGMIVTTLNGTELTVTFTDDGVMIDNAMVTQADIIADNGVVHVINAVLVPEDDCEDEDDIVEEYFGSFFITTCGGLIDYLNANYGYSLSTACNWNGMPMTSFDGEIVADFCDCTCSDVDNTSISEIIQDNTNYLYSIDITGRKIEKMTLNTVVFDVYDSGLVIKRIQK